MASPSQVVASAAEISVDETAENATDNEGEDRVESPGRERFTPPEGVVFHPGLRRWSDDGPVVPVPVALAQAGRCADPLDTLIVFESVLRQGLVGREQLEAIQASFRRTSDGRWEGSGPMPGPEPRRRSAEHSSSRKWT
jgi:hypothetical protein